MFILLIILLNIFIILILKIQLVQNLMDNLILFQHPLFKVILKLILPPLLWRIMTSILIFHIAGKNIYDTYNIFVFINKFKFNYKHIRSKDKKI